MERTAIAALGAVFGLQAIRAFLPLLVYVLRDRVGVPTIPLGGIAFGLFATAGAMPLVAARLGHRRALPVTALALVAGRGLLQIASDAPLVALALAAATVLAFLAFLAALSRNAGADRAGGVLLGGFLDAVIHAAAGTRDLHWGGTFSDVATWALAGGAAFLALRELRAERPETELAAVSPGVGLLAWGPFLFLHLEQFGNVARLSARAGLPTGSSGAIVAAGLALGILLARHLPRAGFWAGAPALLLAATFFGRGLVWTGADGPLAPPTLVVTQLAGAALLARAIGARRPPRGARDAAAFGGGFLLFLALFFAHYAGYDLPIPGSRTVLFLVAGAALLVASLAGAPDSGPTPRFSWGLAAALGALAMLPLARPAIAPALAKEHVPRSGSRPARDLASGPIRVVTFNIHAGFDEAGGFALDEMLFALRREDPDVVALQEVSRGWVINGSADLYELAREVLGLEGVPAPSVVPDWGNAVFTRWPAIASRLQPLPPPDLPLSRSASVVDLGAIHVLATHFHHRADDHAVREEQASFVAGELVAPSDPTPSILLGDFNALPDSRCLAILAGAGWRDVFDGSDGTAELDAGTGTYPSRAPVRRIDTIFFRGPWRLLRARVAPPWGSDHRAVVAEVILEPRLTHGPVSGSGTAP